MCIVNPQSAGQPISMSRSEIEFNVPDPKAVGSSIIRLDQLGELPEESRLTAIGLDQLGELPEESRLTASSESE